MVVINFAHPLTDVHRAAIEGLAGRGIERVIDRLARFDDGSSFAIQARVLVDAVGLSSAEWQTAPLLVCLPGHHVVAAVVLAEIGGRAGYLPTVIRLRHPPGMTPAEFEVAELINLQEIRIKAREMR